MATRDLPHCRDCGQPTKNCTCLISVKDVKIEYGTEVALFPGTSTINTISTGISSGSISGTWDTPSTLIPATDQFTIQDYTKYLAPCTEHTVDKDSIVIRDDEVHGTCSTCKAKIVMPRIAGGLTFEKAGSLVGRAMTLGDGEDDKVGDLLAELSLLEDQISREETRYKRARGMVKIARDLVKKCAVAANAPIE